MKKEDECWQAKLSVLQEMVEHHIEEEEGELFKEGRKVLSKAQSDEIGIRYHEEKERMTASMKQESVTPVDAGVRTSAEGAALPRLSLSTEVNADRR